MGGEMAATDQTTRPVLSVIIPAYQEARRLPETLRDLISTLVNSPRPSEILVIDDGSTDGTAEAAARALPSTPHGSIVRTRVLVHRSNMGKGAAVRTGLSAATGQFRLMMDADNAARVDQVEVLIAAASPDGAGLVSGSRSVQGAKVKALMVRRISGLIFRACLRAMGMKLLTDTQCGFKLYRADVAEYIVQHATENGFAFDVEHLLLAQRAGFGIDEIGIEWAHRRGGQVSPIRDGLRMLKQARRIRNRWADGVPDPTDEAFAPEIIIRTDRPAPPAPPVPVETIASLPTATDVTAGRAPHA